MASTSSREIGFAAAVPAVAPDDAAVPDGADVPADAGDPDGALADGAAFAACLEPKMADTMLPNTLMAPSCRIVFGCTRHADARAAPRPPIRKCIRSPTHSEARWGDDAIRALNFVAVAVRCSCRAATSQPTQFEV
jgi:hypothetical protein